MKVAPLDINNESKKYLDEKELFILYSLLRNKSISTMWCNAFTPNNCFRWCAPSDNEDAVTAFEKQANDALERSLCKSQSPTVFSYLLELGKTIDADGYSVYCEADYSLVEGGFLSEHVGDVMREYLEDSVENRGKLEKYRVLSDTQISFLASTMGNDNLDNLSFSMEFSRLSNPPIRAYREAILNKNADEDFIYLVNKLVTDNAGGRWDKQDVTEFLDIYYRHNKIQFNENISNGRSFLEDDYQTQLAKLIFAHTNFRLSLSNTEKLASYISEYISLYEGNKLDGSSGHGLSGSYFSMGLTVPLHKKLLGIKKQKEALLKHIGEIHAKYGRDDLEIGSPFFEPKYIGGRKDGDVRIEGTDGETELFLFVHTMIALEHDKYLEIEDFSYGTTEMFDLYDRGFLFKVRLKNIDQKIPELGFLEGFDEKNLTLRFARQEIKLAKKGKETDAVLLMRTLLTAENNEWKHNDEILSDWGLTDDDLEKVPKNKVYFAGLKINNAVALKTQIYDFIECNTSKARINPKYRKVDE